MTKTQLINLLKNELKGNGKRLTHSKVVAKKCVELANIFNVQNSELELCGLFHDVCKYYEKDDYLALMDEQTYTNILQKDPIMLHGFGASLYLEKKLNVKDKNLLNAVKYHTTGHESFDLASKILFLADKIDDTRIYPEVHQIRLVSVQNLDYAIMLYFAYQQQLLASKNLSFHPLSQAFLTKLLTEVIND